MGDFNGDGQADILVRNISTGQNSIWLMNGTAQSTVVALPSVSASWSIAGVGEFNGDGQTDLLWYNRNNGQTYVWQMNGTSLSTAVLLGQMSDLNWTIATVGDFNHDAQTDLLWRSNSSGQNLIWLTNGSALSSTVSLTTVGNTNWKIVAPFVEYGVPTQIDQAGNTVATAFEIGTLNGSGSYSGTIDSSDSNDYYRFNLSVTTGVRFQLSGLSGDANLQLLDSSSTVLQSSSNTGSTSEVVTASLSAGTYYVRVYPNGTGVSTNYGLDTVIDRVAPAIDAHLGNDTVLFYNTAPIVGADGITSAVSVVGSVTDVNQISSFRAGFENKSVANYVSVLPQLLANGSFALIRSQLDKIYGSALTEGVHTLTLQAQDEFGNLSAPFSLTFTLDTIAPTVPTLSLDAASDSGSSDHDQVTKEKNPTIQGTAEAGSLVIIYRDYGTDGAGRAAVYANSEGIWQAQYTNLAEGVHTFKVDAGDVAGNLSAFSETLSLTIDAVAPTVTVSSLSNNATLTNNARLSGTTNGTGSAIASVSYYFDSLAAGQTPISVAVQANGSFDAAINFTGISNGAHTLTVKAIDVAGNEITLPAYSVTVNRDVTAPVITAGLVQDTGTSNTDRITLNPAITGTITDASQIAAVRAGFDSTPIGNFVDITAQLQAGSFTLNQSQLEAIYGGTLSQGVHTLYLQASDPYGNLASLPLTFTLDTVAPIAPTNVRLLTSSDSGASNSDRITNDTTPTLAGNAEVGATVKLYEGTQLLKETVAVDGTWEMEVSQLGNGSHPLTVSATDVAGNVSAASPLTVVIDTAAPALSVTTPLTASLTNGARLVGTINGTGSAISSLTYRFNNSPEIALAFNPTTGAFDQAFDFTGISNGAKTLTISATDLAGNQIPVQVNGNQFDVMVALGLPTILTELVNDTARDGYTNTDGITSDPTISGTVTNASQITALRAGFDSTQTASFVNITAQLQADGSFTLSQTQLAAIYGGTLPQGAHTLHLQAADGNGNLSDLFDLTFNLDTTAPIAPNNLSWSSVGTTAVTLSGSAEAGAQVDLFEGTNLVAEAYADNTGHWRVTTSQLRNGTHSLTATATDLAGNTSPASTATSLTINTLVPAMPQGLHLTAATDSGQSHSDGITNDATPTVTGTAEAGATIRLLRGQQLLGQTTADVNGAWSVEITSPLSQGDNLLSAIAHNTNGDSQAATLTVTIDPLAPTAQVKTLATGSESQVALANGATLTAGTRLTGTIDGTGSAIASLRYQLGNLPEVTVPVAENGLFIQALDFGGLSGTQTLLLTFTDGAGNPTTQSYSVTLDTTGTGVNTGPVLLAQLTQDTATADDGWTYVPGIAGVVSDLAQVTKLSATFDASSTAVFQDLTVLLKSDGTFSLDESQLAALTDTELADGEYTLRLQVQTTDNQTIEKSVHFRLDRTAPETSLPDVIDGIAWDRGMHLQGTVQDNVNNVQMSYAIERASDGQSVAQHSFTVAGSTSGTAFDQAISELAAGDSTLQAEEVYNLILTSTDVAGNAQRTSFQFFVPGDRRVTDDDTWTSPTNPNDPPTDPRTPDPNVQPTSGNVNTWGYVGGGGNWGYYGGGGSGGGWTPGYNGGLNPEDKDRQKGPTGSGYEYEYTESINAIVHQAVDFISTIPETIHKKGALDNRQNILLEIGRRLNDLIQADGNFTNDQALIDRMRPAMEGLFADAYDPTGATAGVFDSFVRGGVPG